MTARPATDAPAPGSRAALYERASAQAFAALQQAAIDAIDTASAVSAAIDALERSSTINPDERQEIVARLQQIPAVRSLPAPKAEG
jgi:hypothetical protein